MISTKDKTFQQVFDEIAVKLIEQGKQCMSLNCNDQCAYGDFNGNHCAIGWLLPNDFANEINASYGISTILDEHTNEIGENEQFLDEYATELVHVQGLHDVPDQSGLYVNRLLGHMPDLDLTAWQPWFDMHNNN